MTKRCVCFMQESLKYDRSIQKKNLFSKAPSMVALLGHVRLSSLGSAQLLTSLTDLGLSTSKHMCRLHVSREARVRPLTVKSVFQSAELFQAHQTGRLLDCSLSPEG